MAAQAVAGSGPGAGAGAGQQAALLVSDCLLPVAAALVVVAAVEVAGVAAAAVLVRASKPTVCTPPSENSECILGDACIFS